MFHLYTGGDSEKVQLFSQEATINFLKNTVR